jgi:carbon monoxide dehydrogenase subunit G
MRHTAQTSFLLFALLAAPTWTFRGVAPARGGAQWAVPRSASPPRMAFGLPRPPLTPSLGGLWPSGRSAGPEVLYEGGTNVDFHMETLHLTKRRVSGGVLVHAAPGTIWDVLTHYERMPDFIPNILSNVVTRDAASGRVRIQQDSLLSTRLNLRTSMDLEAVEDRERWTMELRRLSGHGFLEFEAVYELAPRADGSTYLSYSVEVVPCPIFPLPLVERKIRKEVPKMLSAFASASSRR